MAYVLKLNTLIEVTSQLKKDGQKVVLTHGTFDIFHRGHSLFLHESKKKGDVLIVGIEPDYNVKQYKNFLRPVINQDYRAHVVSAHEDVDFVFINEHVDKLQSEYYKKLYKTFRPNIVTYGRNFSYKKQFESKVRGTSFKQISHKLDYPLSTTTIIKKIKKL